MSHRVGLRTQHLGLHKAICVLLGWKSEVAPNVVTWSPETISSAETLAQKEDLIIWPPVVVIHHSSTSDPGTTVEALEIFIRGETLNLSFIYTTNRISLAVRIMKLQMHLYCIVPLMNVTFEYGENWDIYHLYPQSTLSVAPYSVNCSLVCNDR